MARKLAQSLQRRVLGAAEMKSVLIGAGLLLVIAALVLPAFAAQQKATLLQQGKLLTVKYSAEGRPVPWYAPSKELQGILNAQALELGYERQPDGSFKKVAN